MLKLYYKNQHKDFEISDIAIFKDSKISALDIKASHNKYLPSQVSAIYLWTWSYLTENGMITIYGRDLKDFIRFYKIIDLNVESLLVLVHNLSYEYQFVKDIIGEHTRFPEVGRQVYKVNTQEIEFKDTFALTNLTLLEYLKTQEIDIIDRPEDKTEYDQFAVLPVNLLDSIISQTEGLIKAYLNHTKDLDFVPMTSTGFVRKEIRSKLNTMARRYKPYNDKDKKLVDEAFRGGDCQLNPIYKGTVLTDCQSYDRISSYPAIVMSCRFPFGSPTGRLIDCNRYVSYPWIGRVRITNFKPKKKGCMNYIDPTFCRNIKNGTIIGNRLVKADSFETTITDIDYKILIEENDFKIKLIEGRRWQSYQDCPAWLKDIQLKYYKSKTEYKGDKQHQREYYLSKTKCNSVFGCLCSKKSPLDINYAWGCWITAWGRYWLHKTFWTLGMDAVYCDTDSIKFVGEHNLDTINQEIKELSLKVGATANDLLGKERIAGIYELEAKYDKFIALGPKQYATQIGDKMEITVSGVSKEKGSQELEKLGFDSFKSGLVFKETGRTIIKYNDQPITTIDTPKGQITIGSNVFVSNTIEEPFTLDQDIALLTNIGKETTHKGYCY